MASRISVITPSFNQSQFLEKTIQSVVSQQYPNLEYIIIDGGSSDGSVEIIKKYEKYLAFWCSEKDKGMYHAIQKGFEKSTGDILTWINSDDLLFPNSLKRANEIFNRYSQVEWLGGSTCRIDENSDVVYVSAPRKWNRFNYYLGDFKFIQQEGTFWRRSLWEKAGGCINTSYQLAGDLDLWLRFFRYADFYALCAPLGCFRVRKENQKTLESMDDYIVEAQKAIAGFPVRKEDRRRMDKYRFYLRWISKIPLLAASPKVKNHFCGEILQFPSEFYFDQREQQFLMRS
jgi:glycosyltransferase involved in cell wall biosynthesis